MEKLMWTIIFLLMMSTKISMMEKSLETILNEREADVRALLNVKANVNHTHNATEVIYKETSGNDSEVKQQLDSIMEQSEVVDGQGNSLNLSKILFGIGGVVGGAIDGGWAYAVASLQTQVAALQAQMMGLTGESLTSDVLDAFDEVGDVVGGSSNAFSGLRSWANCFSRLRAPDVDSQL